MANRLNIFFLIVWLILASGVDLFSKDILNQIIINPLNRTSLYFDDMPKSFQSKLSDDKKTISLELPSINVVDSCRQLTGQGIINSIQVQTYATKTLVTIMLKDKRGYNAVPLPYSKSVMIEVFNWNDLTPAEDKYRTALLAYEDGIYKESMSDLLESIKLGNTNALAFAGIISLKLGQVNSAKNFLKLAIAKNTDIYDAHAALYHAYMISDSVAEAELHLKQFKNLSGVATIGIFDIDLSIPLDTALFAFSESVVAGINLSEITSLDSALISDTISDTTAPLDNLSTELSDTPFLTKYFLETLIFIAFAILVMLMFFYFRWRTAQQEIISRQKGARFSGDLKEAKVNLKPKQVTDIYSESEKLTKPVAPPQVSPEEEAKKVMVKDIEQILKESDQKAEKQSKSKANVQIKKVVEKTAANPKVELAMHLIEEQRKIKTSQIDSLKIEDLPDESGKLNDIAKKFGIEKGGLETKQAIERLLKDEKYFERISKKFQNQNNNEQ
jgi:hypothetical protein